MIVALDIETTGLSKKDCGICQISMIKFTENWKIVAEFDTYIKPRPGVIWTDGAIECSGITPETVKNAPTFSEKAPEILEFIGDCDILTYNGNTFDIPWIKEELRQCGLNLSLVGRKIYDSMYIESLISPRNLGAVYQRYTGKTMKEAGLSAHNSLSDTKATIRIFKEQHKCIDMSTVPAESTYSGTISRDAEGEYIFIYGKYKGSTVKKIIKDDPNWIAWLIKEKKDSDLLALIQKVYKEVNS